MYAVSTVVHTSNISSCQKEISLPVAVNNFVKVGPLVFLLQMFVITENIMKRPVQYDITNYAGFVILSSSDDNKIELVWLFWKTWRRPDVAQSEKFGNSWSIKYVISTRAKITGLLFLA
jgi:hypothetical protein